MLLRDRLAELAAYQHEGFDPLIAHPYTPLGASLAADRRRAERAAALGERLFGATGLSFLRASYREQCEVTGTLLRMIQAEGWAEELGELVGEALLTQLVFLQEQYELMIVDQLQAAPAGENLRELRFALMRAIGRYTTSVLDLLDEDRPATLAIVTAALRPMIRVRELQASAGAEQVGSTSEPELPAPILAGA